MTSEKLGTRYTETELATMASVHLKYEVHRLLLPVRPPWYFIRAATPEDEHNAREWLGQTILESALLHLRALSAFLTDERPKPGKNNETDVVAADYFDDEWRRDGERGRKGWVFRGSREGHEVFMKELHQRLAHITSRRLEGGFVWTEVTTEIPTLAREFDRFVSELELAHPDRAEAFSWARR